MSDFKVLAPPTLTESVASELRAGISAGRLKPGDRLVEADLATQMCISRAPVREALRQLEYEGLVAGRPRRGYVVRELSVAELFEIYDLRVLVEPVLTRSAAARIATEDLARLHTIVERMRSAACRDDWKGVVHGDREFHTEISRIANRPLTAQIFDHFSEHVRRFTELMVPSYTNLEQMADEHAALLEALASQDPERAANEMRLHLEDARQRLTIILNGRATPMTGSLSTNEPPVTARGRGAS